MDVRNKTNVDHYFWGEACEGWRLLDRPDLSVIRERIPPGRGEASHYHERARQLFFVLRGHLEIEVNETVVTLNDGDALEIEPGTRHRVTNPSDEDVLFLVISAPSTREDRIDIELE